MRTKFYDIQCREEYRTKKEIYYYLREEGKEVIRNITTPEEYAAIKFHERFLRGLEDLAERFKAFSNFSFAYNIGIYLRNKEYDREETVRRDVHYFSALLRVYDSEKTENGHDLIENLVYRLRDFRENWKEMENLYPELFYWKEGDEDEY